MSGLPDAKYQMSSRPVSSPRRSIVDLPSPIAPIPRRMEMPPPIWTSYQVEPFVHQDQTLSQEANHNMSTQLQPVHLPRHPFATASTSHASSLYPAYMESTVSSTRGQYFFDDSQPFQPAGRWPTPGITESPSGSKTRSRRDDRRPRGPRSRFEPKD
jgi:hypothetical protein